MTGIFDDTVTAKDRLRPLQAVGVEPALVATDEATTNIAGRT